MRFDGIHHITAITGDAPRNVDFYTRVLGLRLTAKSVNQDDPSVYHLFYGDEVGSPGADLTFFEYPGALPGRAGAGMVHRIVWRVGSAEALAFWADRLEAEAVDVERGDGSLRFADFEGLEHELVVDESGDPPLVAVHPEIPAELALHGFEGVRAYSYRPQSTAAVLERLMNAEPQDGDRWELRGDARRGWIALDTIPDEPARQSAGTIHHIAWNTTEAEHGRWLEVLQEAGIPNSGLVDRHYFRSIYFREPSGVLFEIATMGPGFTADEPLETLGEHLSLPPNYEHLRDRLEGVLTPLPDPRALRAGK